MLRNLTIQSRLIAPISLLSLPMLLVVALSITALANAVLKPVPEAPSRTQLASTPHSLTHDRASA
jgi:hypothetical protein